MTAYERRISDWSSDVCSSDLAPALQRARAKVLQQHVAFRDEVADHGPPLFRAQIDGDHLLVAADAGGVERLALNAFAHAADRIALRNLDLDDLGAEIGKHPPAEGAGRSEEHTSELQSLMS